MAMHGIHHVTAIAGKPTQNLGFYTRTLGMRFVKKTVNFDDPTTYHLYYGNEAGQPGTILTFFPWEHAAPGRAGIGMAQETSFRVPVKSLGYWVNRFVEKGVPHKAPEKRFGEPVLGFSDPDGLALALVGVEPIEEEATWANGDIPAEHAIRGFHGVTLLLAEAASTAEVLTNALGFKADGREDSLLRFRSPAAPGGIVDIREAGNFLAGRMGGGTVHHIAFRATSDAEQASMANKLLSDHGIRTTPQIDRQYFRSVYFNEPGGVLFEIATDQPGFAVDEPLASLGSELKLPAFLEPRRKYIESALPPLPKAA
jgi:glyoxalase family protein